MPSVVTQQFKTNINEYFNFFHCYSLCRLGLNISTCYFFKMKIRACRQFSHMTAAARCIPPRKEEARLSYLVAIARYCLSFWKKFSTRCRQVLNQMPPLIHFYIIFSLFNSIGFGWYNSLNFVFF